MDCKLLVLLLACVVGPMTCATVGKTANVPEPTSTAPSPPITTTNGTTSTTIAPPLTTNGTTVPPTTSTTSAPTTSTTSAPTSPSTSTPKPPAPAPTSPSTTPAPQPSTTTEKPHPSDRKFDAFSFIGGFALAIGLVAIGFLAWKLYISRRDNVYHTL